MSMDLEGKVAVVTGASRGIGLGIARRLYEAGARLHLVADDSTVQERASELGGTAAVIDISDAAQVRSMLAGIERVDVLVNNAGL
jgi:NAD(P)-dependent dehydrogenase (short-subunit alcohol dehydrogenase family)